MSQPVDYQNQFGPLNFIQGQECSSVVSPGAYLLTLIRLQEEFIDESTAPKHCTLKERRPDLWNIPLDCPNATTPVSFIEVINNILEQQEAHIYHNLKAAQYPFNLPFDRCLTEVYITLRHLQVSPEQLYKVYHPTGEIDPSTMAQSYLELSPDEVLQLTTPANDIAQLAPFYGYGKEDEKIIFQLSQVKEFTQRTRLSYDQLRELLRQNLSPQEQKDNVAKGFFINAQQESYLVSQKGVLKKTTNGMDDEYLTEDDFHYFDRIQLLARLAEKLGWSYTDLNWALQSCCQNQLDQTALQIIALIKKFHQTHDVPIDVVCALHADMKEMGKGSDYTGGHKVSSRDMGDSQTLFDRVFNNPFKKQDGFFALPNSAKKLVEIHDRLLGALQLNQEGLNRLYRELDIDIQEAAASRANLSLLYRISILARIFDISIHDLVIMINRNLDQNPASNLLAILFRNAQEQDALERFRLIERVSERVLWLKERNLTIDEVDFMVTGEPNRGYGRPLADLKREVFSAIKEDVEACQKQRNDFGNKSNQKEEDSHNLNVFEEQTEQNIYITLANIFSAPVAVTRTVGDMIVGLEPIDKASLKDFLVSLDLDVEDLSEVDDSGFTLRLQQWLYMVDKVGLSSEEVVVLCRQPQYFGFSIDSLTHGSAASIQTIYDFHDFSVQYADENYPLIDYFPRICDEGDESCLDNELKKLAQLTSWEREAIDAVQPQNFPEILALQEKIRLAESLHLTCIGVYYKLWEPLWGESSHFALASQTMHSLVESKIDEATKKEIRQSIQMKKGAALIPYVINHLNQKLADAPIKITTVRELYEYLLIDVEMGPMVETSYLSDATTTLQTYFERHRLDMDVSGRLNPDKRAEFEKLWEWTRSYRLWDANRQVFLYPENYIKPELRTEKSELFAAFEEAINKSHINDETVEQAFKTYVDDFRKLARLRIAGSCFYRIPNPKNPDQEEKIFVCFGRTREQPYTYYYRTAQLSFDAKYDREVIDWQPWQKVDLQINAEHVAPIFAYNKIFIFWGELAEREAQEVCDPDKPLAELKSTTKEVTDVQLYYSFQEANQQWAPAQKIEDLGALTIEQYHVELRAQPAIRDAMIDVVFGLNDQSENKQGLTLNRDLTAVANNSLTLKQIQLPEHIQDGLRNFASGTELPVIEKDVDHIWYTFETTDQGSFLVKRKSDDNTQDLLIRLDTNTAHRFSDTLRQGGIDQLLQLSGQRVAETPLWEEVIESSSETLHPYADVPYLDFSGAYGLYYWELFFHAPFYIAEKLKTYQHFQSADHWYQAVCDPADPNVWKFLPFVQKQHPDVFDSFRQELGQLAYIGSPKYLNLLKKEEIPNKPPGDVAIEIPLSNNSMVSFRSPYGYTGKVWPNLTMGMWIKVTELTSAKTLVFYMGSTNRDNDDRGLALVINQQKQAFFGAPPKSPDEIDFVNEGFDFTPYMGVWIYFSGQLESLGHRIMKITPHINGQKQREGIEKYLQARNENVMKFSTRPWDGYTGYVGAVKTLRIWEHGDGENRVLLSEDQIRRSMYDLNTEGIGFPKPDYQWNMQEGSGDKIEPVVHSYDEDEDRFGKLEDEAGWKKTEQEEQSGECVAVSPDGQTLASAGSEGIVHLWDVSDPNLPPIKIDTSNPLTHEQNINTVTFSTDGRLLASAGDDHTIKLWDVRVLRAAKEIKTLDGHTDSVMSVAFSPDSQTLASGSSDQRVKLWDTRDMEDIKLIDSGLTMSHAAKVMSVAFSPDGQCLASAGHEDSNIKLWDVKDPGAVRELASTLGGSAPGDALLDVAFSPDSRILAAGHDDGTIVLWDLRDHHQLTVLGVLEQHAGSVTSLAFSPDGKTLASGSEDKEIKLWDVEFQKEIAASKEHSAAVKSVAFRPDSRMLVAGITDQTVTLWDMSPVDRQDVLWTEFQESSDAILHLINFNGQHYVNCGPFLSSVVSNAVTIEVWVFIEESLQDQQGVLVHHGDIGIDGSGTNGLSLFFDKGTIKGILKKTDASGVLQSVEVTTSFDHYDQWTHLALTWSPTAGAVLYLAGEQCDASQGTIESSLDLVPYSNLYIGQGQEPKAFFTGHLINLAIWNKALKSEDLHLDRKKFLSAPQAGLAGYWKCCFYYPNLVGKHLSGFYRIAFSPDGRTLASGGGDGVIKLWDVEDRYRPELIETLECHTATVSSIAFSPDGRTLASGGLEDHFRLWDIEDRHHPKEIPTSIMRTRISFNLTFSPDGRTLAVTYYLGTLTLWNVEDRHHPKEIQTLDHDYYTVNVVFSPDGRNLALGSDDGTKLWDVEDRNNPKEIETLEDHERIVSSIAFSPDGSILASGGGDGVIKLWDVEDQYHPELIKTLEDQEHPVSSIAFSPDGSILASGSGKGIIKLWDVEDRHHPKEIETLEFHTTTVSSIAFSPDGRTLASVGEDGNVMLWYRPDFTIPNDAIDPSLLVNHRAAINAYQQDPYNPHAISGLRLIAYQKSIMMSFIGNILDWGDSLFRQNTRESIMEAQMFYMRAYNLLGPTPINLGEAPQPIPQTVQDFLDAEAEGRSVEDEFLELENELSDDSDFTEFEMPYNYIPSLYFSIPENQQFIQYWDRVQDRLYKIRHSLNIDGVQQVLPLFEPPIDPMDLVNAQANGGIDRFLLQRQVPVPHYRFNTMLATAKAFTDRVIQLGGALLSALEKQDAEELSRLQNTHGRALLDMTQQMKVDQINQAVSNIDALQKSWETAQLRYVFYEGLVSVGLSDLETAQAATMIASQVMAAVSGGLGFAGSASALAPNVGSPFAMTYGGREVSTSLANAATATKFLAEQLMSVSATTGLFAGWERREQEWTFQRNMAKSDQAQIEAQIKANEYAQKIAQRDYEILLKNIEQEKAIATFLTGKFSSQELYEWLSQQLASLYSEAFQMAHDLAVQAQKAMQYELSLEEGETYLNGTYWSDLHKGLLAGEGLMLDLEKMEKAYLENNKRRFEISKTISLQQHNPTAVEMLKEQDCCQFDLTEAMFDYDFPGHYARQIKTISVSFPAVIGPYENFNATLIQSNNRTILKPDIDAVKYLLGLPDPSSPDSSILREEWRPNEQIALSRGVNDSGLFQLNFQDERYLPFEGTGVVSSWKLELSPYHDLDLESLTDVIITVEYTALSDAGTFKADVIAELGKLKQHSGQKA